jgi:hypothetical protein
METNLTQWDSPSFVELRMDAEVGSYQVDEPGDGPAFARVDVVHPDE